ncbi:hypothetical protein CEP51_013640 [Fusarium floridanum]|uniref:Transmembrane protein 184C n=1 Tax=Fusarium floridanum TaxID=1325733 RepID=A0A428Q7Y8_9HYPO|nr:hypothetical protein CEP51_013640 [Fusarium floridanum]
MAKCKDHPLDVDVDEERLGFGVRVYGLLIGLAVITCAIACLVSAYLIYKHVHNYTKPSQQRQVIRILLMVPVYSVACVFSIIFYRQHVYIAAVYEFYESLVIAAFFLFLCQILHVDLVKLRADFAGIQPKPWIYPIRAVVFCCGNRKKGTLDGLKWFNIICVGVLQFCVIKFLGALVKCITEAAGVYCKESNSPSHARVWIMVIELISLVSAMMCLLQFYNEVHHRMRQHRPMLKFLAIKIVIAVFYIQSFIFSQLTKPGGPAQPTTYISYPSWSVGIPNALLCIEMAFAAIFHLYAFPYQPYREHVEPSSDEIVTTAEREGQFEDRLQDTSTQTLTSSFRPDDDGWSYETHQSAWGVMKEALGFRDILDGVGKAMYWFFVSRRQQVRRS